MTIKVTDWNEVMPIFTNQLVASGYLNGVVNLKFATARFSPDGEGKIDLDLTVSADLRMDLFCAQLLYERLGQIIDANTKPTGVREH
jgi:hypothetical protein